MIDLNKVKEKFWNDGFVHLKSIFKEKDINKLRQFILESEDKKQLSEKYKDILVNEKINKYLMDDRVVKIVQELLDNTPVYFGDSSITIAKKHSIGIYHKDCTDRLDPKAPDWNSKYPLLRIGLFLQDHKKNSGGIILGKYSHNILFKNRFLQVLYEEVFGFISGNFIHCDSKMGDLIIWNLRTTHGPMGKKIKYFINRPVSKRMDKFIPNFLKSSFFGARILVTATFGAKSKHLDRHINYLKTRKYMVSKWIENNYSKKTKQLFRRKGIILYDQQNTIKKEYKEKKIVPIDKWAPYPY